MDAEDESLFSNFYSLMISGKKHIVCLIPTLNIVARNERCVASGVNSAHTEPRILYKKDPTYFLLTRSIDPIIMAKTLSYAPIFSAGSAVGVVDLLYNAHPQGILTCYSDFKSLCAHTRVFNHSYIIVSAHLFLHFNLAMVF